MSVASLCSPLKSSHKRNNKEVDKCPICCDKTTAIISSRFRCSHATAICAECADQWPTCPMCREVMRPQQAAACEGVVRSHKTKRRTGEAAVGPGLLLNFS